MTKILLIEDEYPAAERLSKMVLGLGDTEIVASLDSIENSIAFFNTSPQIDLIFSDIQLSDGLSFKIFEQVTLQTPIIFTTSYDEYAIKAFKVKSIDYLLKPIKQDELIQAYKKYKELFGKTENQDYSTKIASLLQEISQQKPKNYQQRFLVKHQEQLIPITQEQIAYFYSANKMVCLISKEGKQFLVDYTLEELEDLLNPAYFFRLNRQFIASVESISKIHQYFHGKLKLELEPTSTEEVIVSREKSPIFQQWLEIGSKT
ncbi:MAG: LytTR family DNA-binding domain-containing protein [Raineya sp.]|jgi:DNA-binding LytR/AlgR family response regulator|nr:LytTR family DNA-binding domain-containing protein [Raineya sp.]